MKTKVLFATSVIVLVLVASNVNAAITVNPSKIHTDYGYADENAVTFGSGATFDLDAYINIYGMDLNGTADGTSGQMSEHEVPSGLSLNFSYALTDTDTDLTLTYRWTNNTGSSLPAFTFMSFVDAEIDESNNTFFNEYGQVIGTQGTGMPDPDMWEIDEPGFVDGDIKDNLLAGQLDNYNAVPSTDPDDVSMAIGFSIGDIPDGGWAQIQIMLSDDGDYIGSLALKHLDDASPEELTMSGQSTTYVIPAPPAVLTAIIGLAGCAIARFKSNRKQKKNAQN